MDEPIDYEDLTIKELVSEIWKAKLSIIIISIIFAIMSVITSLSIQNQYISTATLIPASTTKASSLSKIAGQFGGLASLAGINLGQGAVDDKAVVALEMVKSWGFLEKFIQDNEIQVELVAVEGWDPSRNELIVDSNVYDNDTKNWLKEFKTSYGVRNSPGSYELFEELNKRISISHDKSTGLIKISVEYYSPYVAKKWVDLLVASINSHLKESDKLEASKSIEFLERQIEQTSISGMQAIFYQLIEEQTKTLMLAEVSDEYVLKTLSAAKVAEEKSKPKRALICVIGTLLGGFLGVLFNLAKYIINKRPSL